MLKEKSHINERQTAKCTEGLDAHDRLRSADCKGKLQSQDMEVAVAQS